MLSYVVELELGSEISCHFSCNDKTNGLSRAIFKA